MNFLDKIEIKGKKLLVRVDYNVPLKDGVIQDDHRIRASLDTLNYALDQGAALIICSHLGRPTDKREPEFSLKPAAVRLSELLGREVKMASDCIGSEVRATVQALAPGQVLMLENLRYHAGEKANDPEFSKQLAALADVYVNDAFAVAHRAHASVVGVTEFAPASCGGFLLKKEWAFLGQSLADPEWPYVAISGGAKISTKMDILNALLDKADEIIIGGAMANTFILAIGNSVGRSLVEKQRVSDAAALLEKASQKGVKIHLPTDLTLGQGIDSPASSGVCRFDAIPEDSMALDIGPETIAQFKTVLTHAKTVMWNGPMGAFENPAYAQGSLELARIVAGLDHALTIVGGGDTNVVIKAESLSDKFSFISTGGGSFMSFMEGKELPAFKALKEGTK
ncbi:phosphoglycerate kinase [Desulfococcaceae bacterium HSG9]|nr:phosphoglycerate kinase [Desulfococcaceae bacterium HSG9]